jgi:uncharacterized protein
VQGKLTELKEILKRLGSAIIAYSGGVDSTFLAAITYEVLGQGALAITAASPIRHPQELEVAKAVAGVLGIQHIVIETDELSHPDFIANDIHRCYHCKRLLFTRLRQLATEKGLGCILEGSNYDDLTEHRPGMRAAAELGVRSPLSEVGLTKAEIRLLSQKLGLSTWDKPAESCLATRIPHGTPITLDLLRRILEAEDYLHFLGLRQLRVRHHRNMARIEVEAEDIWLLLSRRAEVVERFRSLGYTYVTLDLLGYRQHEDCLP